jgi:hypothetical protein
MRRLGLTLVLSLLAVGIGLLLVLIGMIIRYARQGLEPPRVTIEPVTDQHFQDVTFTTEDYTSFRTRSKLDFVHDNAWFRRFG